MRFQALEWWELDKGNAPNWRYDVSPAFQLGIVIIQPKNWGNNQESWACNSRDIRPTILYMGVVCLTMGVYPYDKAIVMWKGMIHLWILGHTMFRQIQLDFTYDLRRPADKLWVFNFIHEYHSFGLGCLWRASHGLGTLGMIIGPTPSWDSNIVNEIAMMVGISLCSC